MGHCPSFRITDDVDCFLSNHLFLEDDNLCHSRKMFVVCAGARGGDDGKGGLSLFLELGNLCQPKRK
jgi:hypothetical protein